MPINDVADRLNLLVTPVLFIFFIFCFMGTQYISSQCLILSEDGLKLEELEDGLEQYAKDYCSIQNTYYVPLHKHVLNDVEKRENLEISYYKWIPVVLALQAVLFYLPFFFWRTWARNTGINVKRILALAQRVADGGETPEELEKLASLIEANLRDAAKLARHRRFLCVRFSSKGGRVFYCTLVYLLLKTLNTANVVMQFYIMNKFLGGGAYRLWAAERLVDLVQGRASDGFSRFPLVTICDFEDRSHGQAQQYSIKCFLMMNVYNEKIYIFLWFWMLMVGVVTSVNLLYWLVTTLLPSSRESQVGRYLANGKGLDEQKIGDLQPTVQRFAERCLHVDGLLLLRLIATDNGTRVSSKLCRSLYDNHVKQLVQDPKCATRAQLVKLAFQQADDSGLRHDDSIISSSAHGFDDGFFKDLNDTPATPPHRPSLFP